MFRGINLCGAEVNTKLSEQHRTHLLYKYSESIIISFSIVVKLASNKAGLFHELSMSSTTFYNLVITSLISFLVSWLRKKA